MTLLTRALAVIGLSLAATFGPANAQTPVIRGEPCPSDSIINSYGLLQNGTIGHGSLLDWPIAMTHFLQSSDDDCDVVIDGTFTNAFPGQPWIASVRSPTSLSDRALYRVSFVLLQAPKLEREIQVLNASFRSAPDGASQSFGSLTAHLRSDDLESELRIEMLSAAGWQTWVRKLPRGAWFAFGFRKNDAGLTDVSLLSDSIPDGKMSLGSMWALDNAEKGILSSSVLGAHGFKLLLSYTAPP
jgi:hypothetical protein